MENFFIFIIIIALASAFVLTLARKWGWLEWMQVHAPSEFLHRLFGCPFCVSFWTCLFVSFVAFIVTKDFAALGVSPLSAVLCVRLW